MTKKRASVGSGTKSGETSQVSHASGNSDTTQIDDTNLTSDTTPVGETENDDKSQTAYTKPIDEVKKIDVRDDTREFCTTEQKESNDSMQSTCTNKSINTEKLDDSTVSHGTMQIANVQQRDDLKESDLPLSNVPKNLEPTESTQKSRRESKIVPTKSDDTMSVDDSSHFSTNQIINLTENTVSEESTQTTQELSKIESTKSDDTRSVDDSSHFSTTPVINLTENAVPEESTQTTQELSKIESTKSDVKRSVDDSSHFSTTPVINLTENAVAEESTQTIQELSKIESTKSDDKMSVDDSFHFSTTPVINLTENTVTEESTQTTQDLSKIESTKSDDTMSLDDSPHFSTNQIINLTENTVSEESPQTTQELSKFESTKSDDTRSVDDSSHFSTTPVINLTENAVPEESTQTTQELSKIESTKSDVNRSVYDSSHFSTTPVINLTENAVAEESTQTIQELSKIESTKSDDKMSVDDPSHFSTTPVIILTENTIPEENTQITQELSKIESTKSDDTMSLDDSPHFSTNQIINLTENTVPEENTQTTQELSKIESTESDDTMSVDDPSHISTTPVIILTENTVPGESTQTTHEQSKIESTKSDDTMSVDDSSHCSTTPVIDLTKSSEPEMPKINITQSGDTAQIGAIKSENVMQVCVPLKSNIEGITDSEMSEIETTLSDSASLSELSLTSIETSESTDMSSLSKKQRKWLRLQKKLQQKYGNNVTHGQEKEIEIKQSNIEDELVLQEQLKQKNGSSVKDEQEKKSQTNQSNIKDDLALQEKLKQNNGSNVKDGQEKKSEMEQSNIKDECKSRPETTNTSVIETASTGFHKYLQVINILTKNPEKCQKYLQNQEQQKQKLGNKYKEPVIYSLVKQISLGHGASSQSGANKSTPETTNSLELLNILYLDPVQCKDWLRKQLDLKNQLGERYQEPVNYNTIKLIALHHSKVANANKSNTNISPNTNIKSVNVELDTTKNPKNVSSETKIIIKNLQKMTSIKQSEINKSTNLNNAHDVLKKDVKKEKTFKENEPNKSTISSCKIEKETMKNDNKTSKNEEDIVYVLLSPFTEYNKVHRMLEKQKQLKSIMGAKYKVPRFDILGKKVSYYHKNTSNWIVRLPFETTTKLIKYKKDLPEVYAIDWVETQIHLFKKLGDKYKPQEYSPVKRNTQQEEVTSPAPDQFAIEEPRNYYSEEQSNVQFSQQEEVRSPAPNQFSFEGPNNYYPEDQSNVQFSQQEEFRSQATDQFSFEGPSNYYPEDQSNVQFISNDFPPTHFNPAGQENNYVQPAEIYYNQPTGFYEASFYPPPVGFFGSVAQTGYYGPIDPSLNYQSLPFFNQPMQVGSHCATGHDLAPPGIGPPVEFPLPAQESPMPFLNKSIDFPKPAAVEANTTITKAAELYNDIPLPPAHAINASIMATTNATITNSSKNSEKPSTTKKVEPPVPTNAHIVTPKPRAADFSTDNCTGNIAFRYKGKDIYYPSHMKKKRSIWVKRQYAIYIQKGDQYTPPEFDRNGKLMPQKIVQLTTIDAKTSKSALSQVKLPDSKELQPMEIPLPPSEDSALKKAVEAMMKPPAPPAPAAGAAFSFDKFGMRINNELVPNKKPVEVSHRDENLHKRKKSKERHEETRQLPKVIKQDKPKPSLNDVFINKTAKITQPPEKPKIAVKLKKDEPKKKTNISKSSEPVHSNIKSAATTSIRLAYQNTRTESTPPPPTHGDVTYPGFLQTFVKTSPVAKGVATPTTPSATPPLSQHTAEAVKPAPPPVAPATVVITGVPKTMASTWFESTGVTSANKEDTGVPTPQASTIHAPNTGYQLYVTNLGPEIDAQYLTDAFAPFGDMYDCYVVQKQRFKAKYYGFVIYLKKSDAELAMTTMNGQKLGSQAIQVSWGKWPNMKVTPSAQRSESFTPPLPSPPEPTTQVSLAESERSLGKSKLSAFERLGPPTEAKKPKLTINLMFAKDEKVEVVREVIEEHVPVYLRQDVIASEDVIVKEYLKLWPWSRTVHVLRECTHASRDIVLDEIEMSSYYSSKSAWIKVVVTGYPQHFKKEDVLDILLNSVKAKEFIPCFIEFSQKKCTFLLNKCEDALSYLHSNGLIVKKDDIKLNLKICQTNLTLDNLKFYKGAVFKTILSNNYDEQTKSLDLSTFQLKPDNSHFMYFPLNVTHNQIFIMNVVKAILPSRNITTLNLSGNRLTDISSFNLSEYLPSLRILDLSNNCLPTVSALASFKGIPMYSLSLEGNPLCHNFIQNDHYIDVVKLIFPRLIVLDGIRVDSKIEFKKHFSVSTEIVDFVNTFLEIFFTLTDSNDRMQMESLYSVNSVFSITCRPEMRRNPMYRNLKEFYMWCPSLNDTTNPLDPLAIVGGPKIARYFTKWPMVAHDPHSFTVDVMQHTETVTILKVTGLFKIPAETLTQDEPVTEFSRTFALVTEDGIEYKIANDMMYISEATPERIGSSFQTVGLQMRSMDTLSLKFETPPDEDLKEKLAEIMMRLTSMKLKSSRRCLEMVNWNLRKALEYFIRLEKVNATGTLDSQA